MNDQGAQVAETSDGQLIREFMAGDVHSFNRLVLRWQGKLYRFAYRYLINEEEAKDVVQAAFIKAYRNLKNLKEPEKFSPWIFQITVNLCKDTLKSSHNTRMSPLEDRRHDTHQNSGSVTEYIADETDHPGIVHKADLADIVQRTLAKLPEDQRIVIIMKEFDEFKFSEIAEILNCPVSTVKARMYYGLQRMHKILTNLDIDRGVLFNEM